MTEKRVFAHVFWFLVVLFALQSCQTTEDITKRRQLVHQEVSGPIRVLTTDSTLYALDQYEIKGSILKGVGTATKNSVTVPFRGEIWLSQISYAQARSGSFFKTLLAAGAVGFMAYSIADALHTPGSNSVWVTTGFYSPYQGGGGGGGGGGSSCPFIYSYNGSSFDLEGEAFSVALGKGLEFASFHLLPHLQPDHGVLRIRIANLRQETHYLNSVQMLGIDLPAGCDVVSDPGGKFYPVKAPSPVRDASDRSGKDIAPMLAHSDDVFWESSGEGTDPGGDYEDRIEAAFDRPSGGSCGTLIVRAINTRLSEAGFAYLGGFLGDQALPFLHQMENNPQMITHLKEWIRETSLKIEVWDGSQWQLSGRILPEANEVSFEHGVRIEVPASSGSIVRIRLRALADVWKIDALALDWTPASALATREIPLASALDAEGRSVAEALALDDAQYVTVLPPEQVDLKFTDPCPAKKGRTVYAVRVGGYLLEWIAESPAGPSSVIPGEARLAFVEQIIARRELLLPPIYAAWNATKPDRR